MIPRSVRSRATLAATLVTAVVLVVASVLIVNLVERDLESNTRVALNSALESASHSVSGEGSEGEGSEVGDGSESGDEGSVGDAQQRAIADASIAEVQAGVDAASDALLIIVPVVVLALGFAIWFTVGRALRPVRDMSAQVTEISGSTLDERVPVPSSDDEIAELATLMNEMLDRLETASDRQRAFVADASHELRSPLATIVAGIEVAAVSDDPQKLQRLAERLSGEAARMQALVSDLLDLARLDDHRQQPSTPNVDLTGLCIDAAGRLRDRDIKIAFSSTEPVSCPGVAAQLDRLIYNLIDNATRHADTQVRIAVDSGPDGAVVTVDDDGAGIAPADRLRVFERFVRLDDSRRRATGGTGIGLALVAAIVKRHGGSVNVGEAPALGGARFTVTLPLESTAS